MPEQALTNVLRSANVPLITPEEDQAQILARQSWLGALGANVPLVTPDENDEQNSQIVGALRASSDGAAGNAGAGADRPRHEPAYVEQRRDAAQPRAACCRWRCSRRPQ